MTQSGAARKKRRDWVFGRLAEEICSWHLRFRGYRILARRFRTAVGEIDIVARRGRTLAVVEVKTRTRRDAAAEAVSARQRRRIARAAEAVSARQRRRIARAAEAFLQQHPGCAGLDARFDVMLIAPWRLPVHMKDAWRITS